MAENIGLLLRGLGAAFSNQVPEFRQQMAMEQENQYIQSQREQQAQMQRAEMMQARQRAMYQDAESALKLLAAGDLDSVVQLGRERIELLKNFPDADPSDTVRITQLAQLSRAGDRNAYQSLQRELLGAVQRGMSMGYITPPQAEEKVYRPGDVVYRDGRRAFAIPEQQRAEETPAALQTLRARAQAAGLVEGTPEYQEFFRTGGVQNSSNESARQNRISNIALQLQKNNGLSPDQAIIEATNIADGNVRYDVLESGQTRRIDLVSGTVSEVPITGAQQPIPQPQQGRTLFELASEATGPVSAARAAAARVGISDPAVLSARTELRNSMQELSKALVVNDRFPVAEVERVRRDTDLDPAIIDNPEAMRARMIGLESYLSRRQSQAERDASDPSLPQSVREGQASNASSIRNFRAVMGVPSIISGDFLSTPESINSVDVNSLKYFIENSSDEDLNQLPDDVVNAIIQRVR